MFYRIYFNQHSDFPFVGSIDTGDDTEEINVKTIRILGTQDGLIKSVYRSERQPRFWLEVDGLLEITDGHALIDQER